MDHARKVLEFDAVLARLRERCESPLGMLLAEGLEPSFDRDDIGVQIRQTAEAFELLAQEKLPNLAPITDLRLPIKVASKGGTIDGSSIYQVGMVLSATRAFRTTLKPKRERFPKLWALADFLLDEPKLEEILLRSVDSDGEVRDEASIELARLRRNKRNSAARLTERIQSYTSGAQRDYLSDPIVTQRSGRYVVPVKAEHRAKVKGIVHDTSSSGQTLFVEPADVVEIGNQLREAEAAERAEVARILANLSSRIGAIGDPLTDTLERAAQLDLILAKARLGYDDQGCVPESAQDGRILIENMRHPLLAIDLAVPLTLELGGEFDGVLITGPNTGGKTVALKTVGLCVLMAQCGMMLPGSRAKVGLFTQVWADIGDEQSLQQSLSTFSGHIKNISECLKHLRPGALVILDEVGAGTDPAEGAALAKAILLEIQAKKGRVIASTHYGELKLFAANTAGFQNCSMEFDPKTLRPTYRLLVGTPGGSHALKIAARYGMPKHVIEHAKQDQGIQEEDVANMLEQLEHAQRRAQKAQSDADRLTHRLREVEAEAERKLAEAEKIRRAAKQKVAEEVEDQMRAIRLEAADLFERLKRAAPKEIESARQQLKNLNEKGEALAARTKPSQPKAADAVVSKGTMVKVRGLSQTGVVLDEPRDGKANVQVGPLKMTFKLSEIEVIDKVEPPKRVPQKSLQLERAQKASMELDLRGVRAEEAAEELERFIDDVILAGIQSVRIVHGKGSGVLRNVTQESLRRHRGVLGFRDGEPNEGGQGVTVATLR